MIVKFIVTADNRLIFGTEPAEKDYHDHIVRHNEIPDEDVRGGGYADLTNKVIFGISKKYRHYNPRVVQDLIAQKFPGEKWKVKDPLRDDE